MSLHVTINDNFDTDETYVYIESLDDFIDDDLIEAFRDPTLIVEAGEKDFIKRCCDITGLPIIGRNQTFPQPWAGLIVLNWSRCVLQEENDV